MIFAILRQTILYVYASSDHGIQDSFIDGYKDPECRKTCAKRANRWNNAQHRPAPSKAARYLKCGLRNSHCASRLAAAARSDVRTPDLLLTNPSG